MSSFFEILKSRNEPLYVFGWACFLAALVCLVLMVVTKTQILGVNAWLKPFKFFLSSGIFGWTMAWVMVYLNEPRAVQVYSWVVIGILTFETLYIALQAGRGQLSHFNHSSAFYSFMFGMMGIAIMIMTVWTLYIGLLFFQKTFPDLPESYVWGIRLGIILFVIFAFEGGQMASRLSHTVGAPDGGAGLPLVNWSKQNGDLRIAHFLGMHALQLLPLLGYYVLRSVRMVVVAAVLYFIVTTLFFFQALAGRPFIRL